MGVPSGVAGSVLVIDDDLASLRLMAATFDQLQYRTICRSDGLSALQAIETTPPLAVVLDLMMPDMSGFEFLEHFRRRPQHRDIPVIIWTARMSRRPSKRRCARGRRASSASQRVRAPC